MAVIDKLPSDPAVPTPANLSYGVVRQNCHMTDQLWAIGGVVAGIVATAGSNLVVERSKVSLSGRAVRREENRKRCHALLASVEKELATFHEFEEQHGVLPIDHGYEPFPAKARGLFTEVELHCSRRIRSTAEKLLAAMEGYVWNGKSLYDYQRSRDRFIKAVRRI